MNPLCFPVWFITDLYPVYARFMKPLCFTVWFINRRHVAGSPTGGLAACLADGLPGWLPAWRAGWLVGRAGWLAG